MQAADRDAPQLLPLAYFARPALELAPLLLGCDVVVTLGGRCVRARIFETEAYHQHDRACHAYGGRRTRRTEPMFGPPGLTYIYFVYGMHWALNIVTGEQGVAEAVLLRAALPLTELDLVAQRRGFVRRGATPAERARWLDGPAKLTQGLGLSGAQNGLPLVPASALYLTKSESVSVINVQSMPRIGVDYAGEDAMLPWRFRCDPRPWLGGS